MALMESTQRIPISQEYAPNPTLMNIMVIANSDDFYSRGVSFELMMDTKMCQRIMRELRATINRLNELLAEISNFKLDHNLHHFMCEFRWKLNKYSIVQSDCYWREKDDNLDSTLSLLEECYAIMKAKQFFTVGDLVYVIKVLETVIYNFELKISQLEEIF